MPKITEEQEAVFFKKVFEDPECIPDHVMRYLEYILSHPTWRVFDDVELYIVEDLDYENDG